MQLSAGGGATFVEASRRRALASLGSGKTLAGHRGQALVDVGGGMTLVGVTRGHALVAQWAVCHSTGSQGS